MNLGRARTAHDILYATACEKDIDVVIISEPNIKISLDNNFIMDKKRDVAIYIRNKDVGICSHVIGDGYVCIRWERWCIIGCYFSPNITMEEFKTLTDNLLEAVKGTNLDAVIAGDFNSKAPLWGSPLTNARGEYLMEWAAELNLNVINTGNSPTFERGNSKSYIDITWATDNLTRRVHKWEVLRGEVHTYHNYIYFEISPNDKNSGGGKGPQYILNKKKYAEMLKTHCWGSAGEMSPDAFIDAVTHINNECTIKIPRRERTMPYWWNAEIEVKRRECLRLRRIWTRNTRSQRENASTATEGLLYKQARKELKHLIIKAKRYHWKSILEDLDNDIWGDGFRIAMKRLGTMPSPYNPHIEEKMRIVKDLFPTKNDSFKKKNKTEDCPVPFTKEELDEAAAKIKIGKAPGPDHISAEAVTILVEVIPEVLLDVLNQLLRGQKFPRQWKEAVVVLIQKATQTETPATYRPICLLSVMGKLYERMIKNRLEEELNARGGFSDRQFGFVKGKSTVHAIGHLIQTVGASKKKWVALVTLDIKNAFNSATWSRILDEVKNRSISPYLANVIEDYFTERKITLGKARKMDISAGVPQGSVLGPTLWNILYDGVLSLPLMEGVTTLAYADDLAVIVEAEDQRDLSFRTNESLERIVEWMDINDLQIAPTKTEAIVLRGSRKRDGICFEIKGNHIALKKELKYLGVFLGDRMSFDAHVKYVGGKAEASLGSLLRIMPNVGGPSSKKREVLYGVVQSQLLYAIPAWSDALKIKKHKETLERIQRRCLLRVISGYRTVSTGAAQVIAGLPPISFAVEEQCRIFLSKENQLESVRKREREATLQRWQRSWRVSEGAAWTRALIPDLVPWVRCKHRKADYYLTQFLTGHGHFQTYRKRFKLAEEDKCLYCGEIDTPEHAVLVCDRWTRERTKLEQDLRRHISKENVVEVMMEKEKNWEVVRCFIAMVLSTREREQKMRQQNQTN